MELPLTNESQPPPAIAYTTICSTMPNNRNNHSESSNFKKDFIDYYLAFENQYKGKKTAPSLLSLAAIQFLDVGLNADKILPISAVEHLYPITPSELIQKFD